METFKRIVYTFLEYLIFVIVTFMILLIFFPPALGGGRALDITSAITALMVWSSLYTTYWKYGGRDFRFIKAESKRNPDFKGTFKWYKGFLLSLPFVIANLILFVLAYLNDGAFITAFRILNISCLGFIMNDEGILNIYGVLLAVFMPSVVCTLGYVVGKTGFRMVSRFIPVLLYSKKDREKQN